MLKKRKSCLISLFLLLNLTLMSFCFSTSKAASLKLSNPNPMKNVTIDGIINDAEWADADWKVEFYLKIDELFNPPDTDGNNYLYLGEDLDNLYVGLDLCSDQTGDITDEWLGIWLNTNNRIFTNSATWEPYLNDGTESMIHDVENDDVYPFFTNVLDVWPREFNDDNEISAYVGKIDGDYTLLGSVGDDYFNITSAPIGPDYQFWVDFSIDITKWFPNFATLYASAVQYVEFMFNSRVNDTITDHKIILRYSNGTYNMDDPRQVIEINNDTSWQPETLMYDGANITADHKIQFRLWGNHSSPFMTQFDYFEFTVYFNQTNHKGGAVIYPISTINTYQIEWGFATSSNNASNHRMFEIQIPKSELEHYDANEDLGIIVGGYGTMTFPNKLFWVFSDFNKSIRPQISDNYKYYNMNGCSLPTDGDEAISGYHLFFLIGIISVLTVILLKKRHS